MIVNCGAKIHVSTFQRHSLKGISEGYDLKNWL